MNKKLILLLFIGLTLSLMVACSEDDPTNGEQDPGQDSEGEPAYTTYEDDYITFEHPEDWLVSGSSSAGINLVSIGRGLGYDFILQTEEISGLETTEDFEAQIADEFAEGLTAAENEDYITQISFEDTTVDGYEGKTLQLEIEALQGTAEALYQLLSEDLNHYEEIEDFLADHDPKSFTREITNNNDYEQEIREILNGIEDDSSEPEQALSLARGRLENIQTYLTEDTPTKQRQKISIVAKEGLVFRLYFFSEPDRFENMIDQVNELMDTLEFVD